MVDDNSKSKGLSKKQDRYFTLTLNFSEKELKYIAKKASGKNISKVEEFSVSEYKKYNEMIREYTRESMQNYAQNFNKGITKDQITWFAKIEHKRRFKGFDKEVIAGEAKSGELKKGLQSHVHITISRMHNDYRINLSPLTNARSSKNLVLNGKPIKGGFDRSNWKQLNENSFDKMFDYERELGEKFETLRTLKNGTLEEKQAIKVQLEKEIQQREKTNQISY